MPFFSLHLTFLHKYTRISFGVIFTYLAFLHSNELVLHLCYCHFSKASLGLCNLAPHKYDAVGKFRVELDFLVEFKNSEYFAGRVKDSRFEKATRNRVKLGR